jgi:thiamine-phosphate diphosphorylase
VAGSGRPARAARRFPGGGIYLIADPDTLAGPALAAAVAAALESGVRLVQYRRKGPLTRAAVAEARALKALCARHGALLIVNDRADLAALAGADGVHVGQDDLPVADVRAVLGPDAWVGVSCHSVAEAEAALREGADYLGFGAVFGTRTKADAGPARGPEALAGVCRAVALPVFAIGGIAAGNVARVRAAGAAGAAVISAVLAAPDPGAAAAGLVARWGAGG